MRLVGWLLVLAVLAVGADRVAVRVASAAVAEQAARTGSLTETPDVEIRGFPFLTQAARGRYDEVVVRARDVPAGRFQVGQFVARLRGVEVPLGDAVSGEVTAVPVSSLTARAVLTYADMTAALADRGLRVEPAEDGLLRVVGSVRVLGQAVEATAVSRPSLADGEVVVTAERFEAGGEAADDALTAALGDRLDFRLELGALPYGLELTEVRAGGDGVVLQARSDGAVLQAGGGRFPDPSNII